MQTGQIIGLDVGRKRTGVARASLAARLAEPLAVVPTEELASKLQEIIADHQPQSVVVGLPRNLENEDTDQTKWVRDLVAGLQTVLPDVDFQWQDEALTTVAAQAETNAKNATEVDAVAAAIILQDFLDRDAGKGSNG